MQTGSGPFLMLQRDGVLFRGRGAQPAAEPGRSDLQGAAVSEGRDFGHEEIQRTAPQNTADPVEQGPIYGLKRFRHCCSPKGRVLAGACRRSGGRSCPWGLPCCRRSGSACRAGPHSRCRTGGRRFLRFAAGAADRHAALADLVDNQTHEIGKQSDQVPVQR